MSNNKSLLSGTFKYSLSAFSRLFLFLLLIVAARYLGAEDFGRFSFAMAFVFLFDPILDPGLYHALIREIARKKEQSQKFLSHALTWKLIAAPIVFLLVFMWVNIVQNSQKTIYAVYLIAISFFLKSFNDAFRSALLAHEFFGLDSICTTVERLFLLIFGFLVLFNGGGLLAFCWVFIMARLMSLIVKVILVKYQICKVTLGFDLGFIKHLLIIAVPIGALYITLNIYNYIDTVMLSTFKTDIEVGWYNASYKIYEGLLIFPVIIGTVFMPRLSQLYKINREAFNNLFLKGLKYIILISIFVVLNGIVLSDKIVSICFGSQYKESIISLNVLLVGILFVFSINFLQTALISMNRQKIVLYLALSGLILNIALNLYLIPKYSYIGAAFATIIVEFLIFVSLLVYTHKVDVKILWWRLIGKPLTALLISALVFWSLFPLNIVYLRLVPVNLCLIALLFFMRVFDKEELELFYNLRFPIGISWKK